MGVLRCPAPFFPGMLGDLGGSTRLLWASGGSSIKQIQTQWALGVAESPSELPCFPGGEVALGWYEKSPDSRLWGCTVDISSRKASMPLRLGQNSLPTLIVPCSLWHMNSGRWSRVEEQPGAAGE